MTWLATLLYALAYTAAAAVATCIARLWLAEYLDAHRQLHRLQLAENRRHHPPPWRRVRL